LPNLTVGVQPGLEEVKGKLEQEGFKVVDISDTGGYLSAMVYSGGIEPHEYEAQSMLEAGVYSGAGSNNGYILMLDAAALSIDEIVARIKALS